MRSKVIDIFRPAVVELEESIQTNDFRLAHYTSLETATKIICNEEIWLRNALVMNDYSEINYGVTALTNALSNPGGRKFTKALKLIDSNLTNKIDNNFKNWIYDVLHDTFIICLSLHSAEDDSHGRLSMWRAYGNAAIVINVSTDSVAEGIYGLPVVYFSQADYEEQLSRIAESMVYNQEFLKIEGKQHVESGIYNMFLHLTVGAKHPGFREEREWRTYLLPTHHSRSNLINKRIVNIRGVPQQVWTIPLKDDPENGLDKMDIPSLLDRIIIGPTDYGKTIASSFIDLLKEKGVDNAEEKVVLSGIPLRTNS